MDADIQYMNQETDFQIQLSWIKVIKKEKKERLLSSYVVTKLELFDHVPDIPYWV